MKIIHIKGEGETLVRYLGSADVPGLCVKYFVFGNRRHGYSIRISEENGGCEYRFVSPKLSDALDLASRLRRCAVFPENLCEILEDLQFAAAGKNEC